METYDESAFEVKVDAALKRIRTILDNTRNPRYPADVPHRYDDKYHLAEFLTRASVASVLQCLGNIGLSAEGLAQLREWAKTRAVTLRLRAQEDCKFLREQTRKVESAEEHVTERSFIGGKTTRVEKVVTTVTDYFWRFDFKYELVAFQGSAVDHTVPLLERSGTIEIKTAAKSTPRPRTVVRPFVDVDVSWLLRHVDEESRASFAIDRTRASCHTPRRNQEVDEALWAFAELDAFGSKVRSYFLSDLFTAQAEHGLDLTAINDDEIFVPVVPVLEGARLAEDHEVAPIAYTTPFLAEQQRSLAAKCLALAKVFPRDGSVITVVEASLLVILLHAKQVCQALANGVAYVEQMLRKQLILAIGKELTPVDFASYMDFHHRKLVKPEYRPRPFSHAVRREDHYPEGVLGLEVERPGSVPDPVSTTVAHREAVRPMSFALDASTRVSFLGDRFLHAWISHQFSGSSGFALSLAARARQFSSFILLVGRIASADAFEPKLGIIVQNKDTVRIPLMLEPIPTPKEFRDAIESLSPEQQRFAKAFRSMQLESTLFGVCVIQIKPQLEKLLKLDPDSLTKEIKLTQELLSLFIEYQIPSDLLSYDGPADAASTEKLAKVKEYAARMQEMIDLSKKREIESAREREAVRLAEANRTPRVLLGLEPEAPVPGMAPAAPPFKAGIAYGAAPPVAAPPPPAFAAAQPPPAFAPPPPPVAAPPPPPVATPPAPPATRVDATSARRDARAEQASRGSGDGGDAVDYTRIPGELDKKFEQLDEDGALRPTIIHPGEVWTRTSQKGLLAAPQGATLFAKEQKEEKNKAFDLLDALSKSGALPIENASLHVVIAATHCFDKTLLDTVIQGNVNPIEKVERSLMIVATTIHGRPAVDLLTEEQRDRFLAFSPRLGPEGTGGRIGEGESA